ncbi:MAG TPA: hypothetical protein DFR83_20135 [Deltaproteobacteria bacterium]|nr:hypothetical protein [Deltaproteobacteria bacterium]
MSSLLLIAAFSALSTAEASERGKNAVHLVYGSYASNDAAFEFYSPNPSIGAAGIRGERALRGPVSLVSTYTRRTVSSEYYDDLILADQMPEREEAALVAAFTGQQFTVGPKLQLDLGKSAFSTYVVGQGLAFVGTSRLDDAPDEDDNLNQLKARSWAPGFIAAGGLEYSPRVGPIQLSTFVELGYNWTAQMGFEDDSVRESGTNAPADMGDLAFRGFYMQMGLGVRF